MRPIALVENAITSDEEIMNIVDDECVDIANLGVRESDQPVTELSVLSRPSLLSIHMKLPGNGTVPKKILDCCSRTEEWQVNSAQHEAADYRRACEGKWCSLEKSCIMNASSSRNVGLSVIEKSKNPKRFRLRAPPMHLQAQANAWMDGNASKCGFTKSFCCMFAM